MTLISRFTRLFHADMNAILDQVEEPESILRQAIREMQQTLAHNERQSKLFDIELQQLTRKQTEVKQKLSELDDQLALCFKNNKDDLAKKIVRHKLETKQILKSLTEKITDLSEKSLQLKKQQQEQQGQLDSMLQKAALFTRSNSSTATDMHWDAQVSAIRDEEIEVAFLHEKQQWGQS